MKIPKAKIKKWCEALRSGEWDQATRTLQRGNRYCCLGVACRLFIPEGKLKTIRGMLVGDAPEDQPQVPFWLRNIDDATFRNVGTHLSELNDEDRLTFDEIADVLEAVYILEVLK